MTERSHVLMTTDAVGGILTYAHQLARGLIETGVRVTMAVLGPALSDKQHADIASVGVHLVQLGGALDWTAADEGEVAASAARLLELSSALRPDLVHLNSPALAAFGSLGSPVLAACHSCVKTWWVSVKGDVPLPDDLAWRAALVNLGYNSASSLVAPSLAFAQATHSAYALKSLPNVVANGCSPLQTSIGAGGMDVFVAGRLWDEGKDVITLDRAIGRCGLKANAAGPLRGSRGEVIALRHIRALGHLSQADLHAQLSSRPIFVSTSLYEPFGLAVLEAAQAGCPLVLSDISTFRELWDGAAVFFPPSDDAALARVLSDLAADVCRRTRNGDASQRRASDYTVLRMTEATLRLYRKISSAFEQNQAAA